MTHRSLPSVQARGRAPGTVTGLQCRSKLHRQDDTELRSLNRYFENDLEFNGHTKRKAGNTDHQPNPGFLGAEDVAEQIGHSVGDPGLVEKVPGGRHENPESHYARDSIERPQMLPGGSERTQSRGVGGVSPCLGVEFFSQPAKILRFVIHHWKHPAEKEEAARLQRPLGVLLQSKPVPIKELIASPSLSSQDFARIQQYFLRLDLTEDGQRRLAKLGYKGFVSYDESALIGIGQWLDAEK